MNIKRLRELISLFPGNSWDEQVCMFADYTGRSRSSLYRWLSDGAPENILDAIEYRLMKDLDD